MGKKSKRKSNKAPPCYHGCITKKEFNCGEFYKILEDYDRRIVSDEEILDEFYDQNKHYLAAPAFGRFVIAHIADDCLKGKDDDVLRLRLSLLVHIRYKEIPRHEGKNAGPESKYTRNFHKYSRDIATERGKINCIAREIPCDCMEEKRIEAKAMEKVAMCFYCRKVFSKEKMLRCKGCNGFQYCSIECSTKDWPTHKEICKKYGVSSASTRTPRFSDLTITELNTTMKQRATPACLPSFGESTDVDAEE